MLRDEQAPSAIGLGIELSDQGNRCRRQSAVDELLERRPQSSTIWSVFQPTNQSNPRAKAAGVNTTSTASSRPDHTIALRISPMSSKSPRVRQPQRRERSCGEDDDRDSDHIPE